MGERGRERNVLFPSVTGVSLYALARTVRETGEGGMGERGRDRNLNRRTWYTKRCRPYPRKWP
jgi:hypothetical protein